MCTYPKSPNRKRAEKGVSEARGPAGLWAVSWRERNSPQCTATGAAIMFLDGPYLSSVSRKEQTKENKPGGKEM